MRLIKNKNLNKFFIVIYTYIFIVYTGLGTQTDTFLYHIGFGTFKYSRFEYPCKNLKITDVKFL